MKTDAIPSQWPNCPPVLSKQPTPPRSTCRAITSAREDNQRELKKIKEIEEREADQFMSLVELDEKLDPDMIPSKVISVLYRSVKNVFVSI